MNRLLVLACFAADGCVHCTQMACNAWLEVVVGTAIPADAEVTIALEDGSTEVCTFVDEPLYGVSGCEFGPDGEGSVVILNLGSGTDASTATVTVTWPGEAPVVRTASLDPIEPVYPNGERCGPECVGRTAEISL